MYVYIYKLISPSGKQYIGQVIEKKGIHARWKQHINTAKSNPTKGSRYLNSAILKYGSENFIIEKICKVHSNIKDITEQFCIQYFKTFAPQGYNLQSGGTYTIHSDETKKRRSESLKKLLKDPEKREIWRNAKLGKSQGIKNNRKYLEDKELPKYIRRIRGKYNGFCIDSHPMCKCKKFTSIKLTSEEKFQSALDFLKQLDDMASVQKINNNK